VESNRQGTIHFGHSPFADLRLSVPFTEYGIECLRETIADERAAGHALTIAGSAPRRGHSAGAHRA
jgi:hypothetical protein